MSDDNLTPSDQDLHGDSNVRISGAHEMPDADGWMPNGYPDESDDAYIDAMEARDRAAAVMAKVEAGNVAAVVAIMDTFDPSKRRA